MSYEAVPCMFRSSAQNGNGETQYLGLLIRPSANQQNSVTGAPSASIVARTSSGQPVTALTPTAATGKVPQPLLVQGVYPQGAPIVVQGENPKVLVPAKVQVRLQQGGDASVAISPTPLATSTFPVTSTWSQASFKAAYAPPVHNALSSPCNSQPRSLSVSSASPQLDSSPMSPLPNIMHYQNHPTPSTKIESQNDPRSTRVTASGQWAAPVSDSSTTPDSGIQSVPGSPPSSHPLTPPTIHLEGCDSVCEERYENDEDFADMPRLLPADQEETQCSTGCVSLREDATSAHGSECETAPTPSISITPSMDSKDIVEQLIMLDPEKANAIANLIKRRQSNNRKRSGSKQEIISKRGRPTSTEGEDPKISDEDPTPLSRLSTRSTSRASHRRTSNGTLTKLRASPTCEDTAKDKESQDISSAVADQTCLVSQPSEEHRVPSEITEDQIEIRKRYREAIKRMLKEQLASLLESTAVSLQNMHIGLWEKHDRRISKERRNIFAVNWEQVRKTKKRDDERKRVADRIGRKKEAVSKKLVKESSKLATQEKCDNIESSRVKNKHEKRSRKRRSDSAGKEKEMGIRSTASASSKSATCNETSSHGKREKEYEEISRSVALGSLPEWESPVLSCGCTRGACTSDSECVNRALRVQCAATCTAPLCLNKRFWKDDVTKTLTISGSKTRKILRTRQMRRAGEFLCEFAGDVLSFEDAKQRWEAYSKTETSPIILCLTSRLFIDATARGNLSRFVRQSCKPNARLEVWSVNGNYRAGLFSIVEIASGAEVTIDMNGLLPVSKNCNCGASDCRKRIVMARNAAIASASDLSINEERAVRKDRVFLIRNRQRSIAHAASRGLNGSFEPTTNSQIDGMRKVLKGIAYRVRRIDGRLPLKAIQGYHRVCRFLCSARRNHSRMSKAEVAASFDAEIGHWLDELADDDIERAYMALRGRYISDLGRSEKDEKPKRDRRKENRFVNQDTNLEYIESNFRVGGYDPDDAWPLGKANEKDDAVRCVCGSLEEDGEMTQCDTCNFWLHSECLSDVDQDTEYKCHFCRGTISGGRPFGDVILAKQPSIRLSGCTYYKALVNNRSIQVRLNETVHVQKATGDDHKKVLKKLMDMSENTKKSGKDEGDDDIPLANCEKLLPETFDRKDLRVFRVERLFAAPRGHRFVFGFYYARPHETFCDSQRIFHRNEVFATPLYDTLPLDAVVGRCTVLDPSTWCIGRPIVPEFKEADIYLCEYQIDRNQRSFEKIPIKNRYPINTQPYVFRKFEKPTTIKRDFTPFVVDPTSTPLKTSHKVDKDPSHTVNAGRFMIRNLAIIIEKLSDPSKRESNSQKEEQKAERCSRK